MSRTVLVTGGSGFFGNVLSDHPRELGDRVVGFDLQEGQDLRDENAVQQVFEEHRFDAVFHCAAMLAHAVKDKNFLWESNVDGTRNLVDAARNAGVAHFVFTSSNCVFGRNYDEPVSEQEPTGPVEIYGESKLAAEEILKDYAVSIRTPTIIDEGRLGLLTILFDFIREGRKVWVVGKGENRYQFVYAKDLADACDRASRYEGNGIFNVGSRNVRSLKDVYNAVIERAGTGARVATLPATFTLAMMRLAFKLGLSPLGPYQNRMITSSFVFDTSKIEREMGWQPTLTNEEILWRAYRYYDEHYDEIHAREDVSAHKQAAKMGVIRLLKWMS
ncbi:MAG: NAD-dependent epimerase/dehydratase family protein [Planctomycetota bacterium]|jgi:nucleoside-diphosphate-sugar epimerase